MAGSADIREAKRVLVLAAHPHDEFSIAATLRAHARAGDEVWAAWFARDDRDDVEQLRRSEACRAAVGIGIAAEHLLFSDLDAMALPLQLAELVAAVRATVEQVRPHVIFAPAFEGGHPDHDAVNFAVYEAALDSGAEVFEYPIYRKAKSRRWLPRIPRFVHLLPGLSEPQVRHLTGREIRFKHSLWHVYRSQQSVLGVLLRLSGDSERFFSAEEMRPIPLRDYTRPPHERPLLYEEIPDLYFTFEEFESAVRHYHWSGGVGEDSI